MRFPNRSLVPVLLICTLLLTLISCTNGNNAVARPAPTPNIEATVQAAVQDAFATNNSTPAPTPNIPATVEARVASGLATTAANIPTLTPTATSFPLPTITPTPEPPAVTDKGILMTFFALTGGTQWGNSQNWLTDLPLAEWHGVTTNDDGRVIALNLPNNNLTSAIPPELGDLSSLSLLTLTGNNLTGEIPTEFGRLSNLSIMEMRGNELTGTIPQALANLHGLKILDLSENQLSGPIPPELGNLVRLTNLSLNNNSLNGTVPPALGALSSLLSLTLHENNLAGELPQSLGSLSRLQVLGFTSPETGLCAPSSLEDWVNGIETVEGQLCPPEATVHSDREALVALYNATNGPEWVNNWNWLTDKPLGEWNGVTTDSNGTVIRLILAENKLNGEIPPEIGNLLNLSYIHLGFNNLRGEIPPELGNLLKLNELFLNFNGLTGEIPPEIGNLHNLEGLYILGNQLTGELPLSLTNLESINSFSWGQDSRENELCAPLNPIQDWLREIEYEWGGPTCPRESSALDVHPTAVPTPVPSPTPTPQPAQKSSPVGLTLDNPVEVGGVLNGSNGVDTVVVRIQNDAWTQIRAANQFNDPPESGNRFYMVTVEVSYPEGSGSVYVSGLSYALIGDNRVVYTTFGNSCGVVPDQLQGELFPGGKTRGNICFEVSALDTNLVLIHQPGWDIESRRFLRLE